MFGYTEAAIGLGLMMGPAIGQVLYSALDFEKTFYCTSGILVIPAILTLNYIPTKLNKSKNHGDRKDSMMSSNYSHGP